jgi:hypothetical protein
MFAAPFVIWSSDTAARLELGLVRHEARVYPGLYLPRLGAADCFARPTRELSTGRALLGARRARQPWTGV